MSQNDHFTIALPSGRMAEESLAFFQKSKLAEFDTIPEGRGLTFWDKDKSFRFLLVRSQDVPTYVLQGGADAGITGRDVLMEGSFDLTLPCELDFGKCRLCVACLPDFAPHLLQKSHLRVATKYPKLAADFFYRSGMSCEIIKLHGSIELAPLLSLSDCIVDLVSTGLTLKENGLVEVCTIMKSSAVFVVSRCAYALQTKTLAKIFSCFKQS